MIYIAKKVIVSDKRANISRFHVDADFQRRKFTETPAGGKASAAIHRTQKMAPLLSRRLKPCRGKLKYASCSLM
ncbi:hypothetical protein SAMN05216243_1503 [Sediminibacillus albus]|uniref:Uncharacterized protein n=1 Tax=Sediminibacillus albus TaxID=407036 RepID=A0A1G8YC45_9BACI|nr:hypothetical protein SAMN05216243_1503 [Sediminibacillus albus]